MLSLGRLERTCTRPVYYFLSGQRHPDYRDVFNGALC